MGYWLLLFLVQCVISISFQTSPVIPQTGAPVNGRVYGTLMGKGTLQVPSTLPKDAVGSLVDGKPPTRLVIGGVVAGSGLMAVLADGADVLDILSDIWFWMKPP